MLVFLLSISDESYHNKIIYLYETYHMDMICIAKSRLRNCGIPNYAMEAENAVQNSFVNIIKYIDRVNINVDPKELKAYLVVIVLNEVKKIIREYKPYEDIDNYLDKLASEDFVECLCDLEQYEEVVNVIRSLDDKYTTVLLLYYQKEMSVKEIAECLGMPVNTVYTNLNRAKKVLLKILKKENSLWN